MFRSIMSLSLVFVGASKILVGHSICFGRNAIFDHTPKSTQLFESEHNIEDNTRTDGGFTAVENVFSAMKHHSMKHNPLKSLSNPSVSINNYDMINNHVSIFNEINSMQHMDIQSVVAESCTLKSGGDDIILLLRGGYISSNNNETDSTNLTILKGKHQSHPHWFEDGDEDDDYEVGLQSIRSQVYFIMYY